MTAATKYTRIAVPVNPKSTHASLTIVTSICRQNDYNYNLECGIGEIICGLDDYSGISSGLVGTKRVRVPT